MQLMESNSASHTDWSMIANASQQDEEVAALALEQMVKRYWPAVYAYIRKTGRSVHEASDLTQGFICDVMIARRLAASADSERGRFRTLLLCSLKNYLVQEHRRKKHRPLPVGEGVVSEPPSRGWGLPRAAKSAKIAYTAVPLSANRSCGRRSRRKANGAEETWHDPRSP